MIGFMRFSMRRVGARRMFLRRGLGNQPWQKRSSAQSIAIA